MAELENITGIAKMTTRPFLVGPVERLEIARFLRRCLQRGRRNAIRGKELAFQLGLRDDRKIRLVIRELIAAGWPIASSVTEPMGFYLVANGDEAADYIRILKERIKEDESRLADFRKAVANMTLPEQAALL